MRLFDKIFPVTAFFVVLTAQIAAAQETLQVGVIAPLSGPVASMGQSLTGAFQLIDSKTVAFTYQDDQCDAKKALAAYTLLTERGVRVFYVACSGSILAIAPRARTHGQLLLTSYAGSTEIRKLGSEVIRFDPDAVSDGEMMIDYLRKEGLLDAGKKFALFYEEQDYAVSLANLLKERVGDHIGYQDSYRSIDASFKTQIVNLVHSGFSSIVFIPTSDVAAQVILKEMHELGMTARIIGEANLCDYPFKLGDFELKGVCFKADFEGRAYADFRAAYKKKNGRESQYPFYDAITYDIGIILDAFSKTIRPRTDFVPDLKRYLFSGVKGTVSSYEFEGHGEVKNASQYLHVVETR